jgi:hypothetical protein
LCSFRFVNFYNFEDTLKKYNNNFIAENKRY